MMMNAVTPFPPARRILLVLCLLPLASLIGCGDGRDERPGPYMYRSDQPDPLPLPDDWTEADTQRVAEACSRCHMAPEPDGLPREYWDMHVMPAMLMMPLPEGVDPLTDDELDLAITYYTRRAPGELAPPPKAPESRGPIRFETNRLTLPDAHLPDGLPAVANVAFAPLTGSAGEDLLICDVEAQALLRLPAGADADQFQVLARDLNSPVKVEATDLTDNGRADFLVTGIGDILANNETRGSVVALRQTDSGELERERLIDRIGRPTDARAADFNNNGRLDVLVCSFGWREPGQLLLLENIASEAPDAPQYERHVLDDRDGWIHAVPYDVEGNGRLDIIALVSQEHQQVVWFRNRGGLEFDPVVLFEAPHPSWGFTGLELADLSGNGEIDILVSNGDTLDDDIIKPYHGIAALMNQGPDADAGADADPASRFVYRSIAKMPGCTRAVAADITGNGRLDVVAVAFLPQFESLWEEMDLASVIWVEQTEDGWVPHTLERHRCYHPTVAVGDFTGNGKTDIAAGNYAWPDPLDGQPFYRIPHAITLFTQK